MTGGVVMTKFQITVDALLEPIMPRYLEIRLDEVGQMENAIGSGDVETVRLLGHRLKGTGTSYGFEKLTHLGAAIEKAALKEQLDKASGMVADVRAYLENVEIVFEESD